MSQIDECSAACGTGVAQQNLTCVQFRDGLETVVDDSLCPAEEKPPSVVPCVVNVCPLGWDKVSLLAGLVSGASLGALHLGLPVKNNHFTTGLWEGGLHQGCLPS